jgi:hypothetical protein
MNETYSRVRVSKHFSDKFPIRNALKKGDVLRPLLFNSALENAIIWWGRGGQVNKDGLKLNGSHHLLFYAVDVNLLGGSVHTIKKVIEA